MFLMGRAAAEDIHLAAPMHRHLDGHVSGSPEAVQAQTLPGLYLTEPERPVADDPGTKKRCGLVVRKDVRNPVGEFFGDDHELGVSAVSVIAGEAGAGAQVFAALPAVAAFLTNRVQPGRADAVSPLESGGLSPPILDRPYHLMAGDDGQSDLGQFALDRVEIGVAHPADFDADEDLVGRGGADGDVRQLEGILFDGGEVFELHGFHGGSVGVEPSGLLPVFWFRLWARFLAGILARYSTGLLRSFHLFFQAFPAMGEILFIIFRKAHGQDIPLFGVFVSLREILFPVFEIHGKLAQRIEQVRGGEFRIGHFLPQGEGLVPLLTAFILRCQTAPGGQAYLVGKRPVQGPAVIVRRLLVMADFFQDLAGAEKIHGIDLTAVRIVGENGGSQDHQAQQGEDVFGVVIENRLDQLEISGLEILEIAPGNLGGRNVLLTPGGQDLAGQEGKPAAFYPVFPEAAGREQEIQMRQSSQRKGDPVEDEAGLEERDVEGLAVKSDDALKIIFLKEPGQVLDHLGLGGQLTQEILADPEFVAAEVAHADVEGHGAGSTRETGGLEVQEEGGGKIDILEFRILAEAGQDMATDLEAGREGDLAVADVQRVLIFGKLEGFALSVRYDRGGRLDRRACGSELYELLQFLAGREGLVFIQLRPGVLDGLGSGSGFTFPFELLELVFDIGHHDHIL